MARKKLIRTSEFPYHVTIRCNNKEWFDLEMGAVWRICIYALSLACKKHGGKVQAFVLMNNHYHLLLWTPNENIDEFMFEMNKKISFFIRMKTGRVNRIFGDRYKWSLILDDSYYQNVIRYIYQNPVRAKLVKKCESYRFSTLYYFVNNKNLSIDLFRPLLEKDFIFIDWINLNIEEVEILEISKGLKKTEFNLNINR